MKFVFIGAGNVASSFAPAIQDVESFEIVQVWSHTLSSAQILASRLECSATNDLSRIIPDADVYIYALKDSVLADIISQIIVDNPVALHIHTAGSIGSEVFGTDKLHGGVMYPFQTFTRSRKISLAGVPLFIDSKDDTDKLQIKNIAQQIGGSVYDLTLENRKWLHLAGVFTNNFSNVMLGIAQELVEKAGLPTDVLFPLMHETVDKLHSMPPLQAQTGPARRGDRVVMKQQYDLLDNPKYKQIYQVVSEIILEQNKRRYKLIN